MRRRCSPTRSNGTRCSPEGSWSGGTALCGVVAAGPYADAEEAVREAVAVRRRHDPTPERVERYRAVADAFRDLDRRLWGREPARPSP